MVKNGCGQSGHKTVKYIWRMDSWNELIFCMLVQIQES